MNISAFLSNKKLLIAIAVVAVGLAIASYLYLWQKPQKGAIEQAGDTAQKIMDSATQGVLPSIETNPLQNKPNINPVDKANPFKNIKTNPFAQ